MGPGDHPTFRQYGVQALEERLGRMLALVEPVRLGEDVEAIHDIRVASRRLRAAISVFEPAFPGKAYRRFNDRVRDVTRRFSLVREVDVLIGDLRALAEALPEPERGVLAGLIERQEGERRRLQPGVEKALRRLHRADLPGRLREIAGDGEGSGAEEDDLEARFAAEIGRRVSEMQEYDGPIRSPANVRELHELRIAAKRLRYAMELFARFRGPLFKAEIRRIKAIQETLGHIHDSDVLIPVVLAEVRRHLRPAARAEYLPPDAVSYPGAQGALAAARGKQEQRDAAYAGFLQEWQRIQDEDLFREMLEIVGGERPDPRAAKDPPAAEAGAEE
jgi:CHAD domain-containing protein